MANPNVTIEDAIENIDIFQARQCSAVRQRTTRASPSSSIQVTTVEWPIQRKLGGDTTLELRRELAVNDGLLAYLGVRRRHCVASGQRIRSRTTGDRPLDNLVVRADKTQDLRYGENPHQRAALYGRFGEFYEQLHGKELSYNNTLDLTAAAHLIVEYDADPPTLAILKHTNPCGLGQAEALAEAWDKAFVTDKQAPFGGIIACNTALDLATAEQISEIFTEVIVAPDFSEEALGLLQQKKICGSLN